VWPPRGNPQEIAIEAMNNSLADVLARGLNMNLREDKHCRTERAPSFGRPLRAAVLRGRARANRTDEGIAGGMNKEFRGSWATISQCRRANEIQANETLKLPDRGRHWMRWDNQSWTWCNSAYPRLLRGHTQEKSARSKRVT